MATGLVSVPDTADRCFRDVHAIAVRIELVSNLPPEVETISAELTERFLQVLRAIRESPPTVCSRR